MPTYFNHQFVDFFKELSKNNNTQWFNENKKSYETHVKLPFIKFIDDLIIEMSKLDETIAIEAKDAITRINRDIRFSKDKSPYKMHVSAIISAKGKKVKEVGQEINYLFEKKWEQKLGRNDYHQLRQLLIKLCE